MHSITRPIREDRGICQRNIVASPGIIRGTLLVERQHKKKYPQRATGYCAKSNNSNEQANSLTQCRARGDPGISSSVKWHNPFLHLIIDSPPALRK
ncbi:uncharacterized protein CIMG_12748 [Coccidioides immitis RS]|uniref:Uncharacterized protein n=1 Tax=Coccidioides immitis (strain RS) TaxID=246410 RepID=A0A0D8JS10_COCIM|nr:uncharacterized protein CIMG_12748 [Coccidioides immitis RS]KJF60105.1 hypothetical protein CIMG_12748 [Coccidioides immitis RS]